MSDENQHHNEMLSNEVASKVEKMIRGKMKSAAVDNILTICILTPSAF